MHTCQGKKKKDSQKANNHTHITTVCTNSRPHVEVLGDEKHGVTWAPSCEEKKIPANHTNAGSDTRRHLSFKATVCHQSSHTERALAQCVVRGTRPSKDGRLTTYGGEDGTILFICPVPHHQEQCVPSRIFAQLKHHWDIAKEEQQQRFSLSQRWIKPVEKAKESR